MDQQAALLNMDRLKCNELAEALRVKVPTIRKWTLDGMPYRPVGRLRFFSLAAVEAWLEEKERLRLAKKHDEAQN